MMAQRVQNYMAFCGCHKDIYEDGNYFFQVTKGSGRVQNVLRFVVVTLRMLHMPELMNDLGNLP